MKKKLNKADGKGRASATCSQFWLIDMDSPGEHERSRTAIGPFKSYAKAEKWLREDAADTYLGCDGSLRDGPAEEWGSVMVIVEERRRVRPVPKVSVSIRLAEVDAANASAQAPMSAPKNDEN